MSEPRRPVTAPASHAPPLTPEIVIEDERWSGLQQLVAVCFETVTAHDSHEFSGGGVAILFADDATVHDLNARFRGKDKPTNVLSFPSGEEPDEAVPEPVHIGDIALAWETCEKEAAEKGIPLKDHAAHLILHGILHLFGYDHVDEDDAAIMENLETTLLARMGIADPYAE